ncbi:class II aldolase/adducin family protein [Salmonella enterica subsp. enterica]|nr:class II aldolase/adducin family protein [Salmonella enterica subsp. enterica]
MKVDDMVVVDMDIKVVEGGYRPSSDTATHLALYQRVRRLAASFIPLHPRHGMGAGGDGYLGARYHARGLFLGDIPCTRLSEEEVQGEYELEHR